MKIQKINRIIISRTDSIGDVMLVLPICAWIKKQFPSAYIYFLGSNYTKSVIECYSSVDEFIDWTALQQKDKTEQIDKLSSLNADVIIHAFPRKEIARLAKKAKIKYRIGTSHRIFHFLTCNVKIDFTRKKSPLHESQLNFELLRPLGLNSIPSFEEVNDSTKYFIVNDVLLPDPIASKLKENKNIILHPKSQGSAVEWGVKNYVELATKLVNAGFNVFFTGTEKEGLLFRDQVPFSENIIDTTGQLTLEQLIFFISKVDALVACSTGPLHIAGFTGIKAVGLFSPKKPIHPGRWKALGKDVNILVNDENCSVCASKQSCNCIEQISTDRVFRAITSIIL